MGASSSSLLDESKISYIRGRTEAELKNFTPHYRRQSCVTFFSYLKDEVEQHRSGQAQLLKQKEPLQATEVLYKDSMLYFDDNRKWRERFVVVCADYSLELHDSQETFTKGTPARHKLLPTGGAVLTSEEKYNAVVDKALPDPNGCKEESSVPLVVVPGPLPVYLRLPYRRDYYFCFQQEEKRARFVSILNDCIRHQNQDYLKSMTCEVQAFLKAIHFYRQEKGHYESWEMLVGTDLQVLAYLVMEELLPSLQTELLPKLKGKKPERKRVWFATVEATYELVQEQLREGLESLKNECRDATKQQEALIRSDMDQITNSQTFLEMKLQALVSEPAMKYSSESVAPYLASILEELMGPVSAGFQAVRLLLEDELTRFCKDFPQGGVTEEFQTALEQVCRDRMEDCYQHVNILNEQLQELRNRFKFSNSTRVVHSTQGQMQQLTENAVYTFKLLLQSALMDKPDKQASVMEKAKLRVLKQFDYDSSTVRKKIFQEALVDITLPAIMRNLAPACKTELQNYEQFVFADYANFVQVENVYENILLNILNNEVNKVVKDAANLKKNNLFADSTDLYCVSQSSLADNRTPPISAPSSPPKVLAFSQQAGQKTISTLGATIIEETHQTHDTAVIPMVKITVSSPESLEPTLPSSIAETVQPDIPSTIPNISSPALEGSSNSDAITVTSDTSTPKPDISETNTGSNTSDAPTAIAETILSTEDLSLSGPEKLSSEVQDRATEEPLSEGQCSFSSTSSSVSSDRAVSLNSTVVLKTGSPGPLAETSETVSVVAPLCVSAATDEDNIDAVPQSEIQPDSTPKINENIETEGDAIVSDENTVNNRACDVVPSSVENRSEEQDTSHMGISTLDSVPDVPVGSAVALTSEQENQSDTSTNSPEQDCTAGDEDTEDVADSVKAIKDLIMEVIEVEDIVRPCVEN
ncbi:protein Niban 1-like [Xyrauchen texanus]|uniref:protein Niban 1-like n=1 Tax=Xyrauchen texanus TaxID=154827 RepID=UPI0022421A24|nr:protein Niban 1-like [Xyrauchen texanus]